MSIVMVTTGIGVTGSSTPFYQGKHNLQDQTTSGDPVESSETVEETRSAIHELRKLSGLTWDQLAKLFNVTRRSLHFWASGKPLSAHSEQALWRMLGTIQSINRGSAAQNRQALFQPIKDGTIPFDLLVTGQHERVRQILGCGYAPQKPELKPVSAEEQHLRRPPKPEDLVDALQDPIHRDIVGRARSAKVSRIRSSDKPS
ncbi:MAG: XRE family transcriptional regulator [Synechococcaceae cyanobacterium SM2_3_2]|nr:XRE family transcriptional regulator [Synechococcaceae cyanobacterium SM2_3_2]